MQDADFVVATDAIERTVKTLEAAGFQSERFDWSINIRGALQGRHTVQHGRLLQGFLPAGGCCGRAWGILLRVASLEETLRGKMKAWQDSSRRQSKRLKDQGDIARLIETHPELWDSLTVNF